MISLLVSPKEYGFILGWPQTIVVAWRQACVCAVSGVVPAVVFQLGLLLQVYCSALSSGVSLVCPEGPLVQSDWLLL